LAGLLIKLNLKLNKALAFIKLFSKKEFSDEQLMDKFKKFEDQDALALLYERYLALVFGICLKYLQNREDAEDASMEIYETIKTQILRFEVQNFKSWLAKIAVNHCLMKLRSEKRKAQHAKQIEQILISDMELEQTNHLQDKVQQNQIEVMLKALENLKEDQRNCIMLFYFHKHSYIEIAQLQKLSENEVKSHIQNGKRNLKLWITKAENKEE